MTKAASDNELIDAIAQVIIGACDCSTLAARHSAKSVLEQIAESGYVLVKRSPERKEEVPDGKPNRFEA